MGAIEEKERRLKEFLGGLGRPAVAFSGGVDSTLLLKIARDTLGAGKVLALHGRSAVQKPGESERAVARARAFGFSPGEDLLVVDLDPLSRPEFIANGEERCYVCKRYIFGIFLREAEKWGASRLLDGTNTDDLREIRPGLRALAELGVDKPFVEAGLCKDEVRELSRRLELDTWNQPSSSCLATRIPFHLPVSRERLERIARWEAFLEGHGFSGCRARLDRQSQAVVYIQLRRAHLERLAAAGTREELERYFREQGVGKVYVDLAGRW